MSSCAQTIGQLVAIGLYGTVPEHREWDEPGIKQGWGLLHCLLVLGHYRPLP